MGQGLDLLRHAYDLHEAHDMERLRATFGEFFTDDVEIRNPMGTFRGREILSFWEGFGAAFPDLRYEILQSAEQDDLVAVEGRFTGTHTGPMTTPDGSEIPPTGRSVALEYAHMLKVDGGRFSSWHVYFDTTGFMQQLGIVPEMARA